MDRKTMKKPIIAVLSLAVLFGMCFVPCMMTDSEDSSADDYGTEYNISVAPGMRYTWGPAYNIANVTTSIHSQTVGSISGTAVTIASYSSSSQSFTDSTGTTYSADGLLTINIPSNATNGTVYYVVMKATSADPAQTLYYTLKITVGSGLIINGSQANVVTGCSMQITPTVSSNSMGGTLTWTASGLPSWLSINSSTGVITGTAGAAGTYTFTVTATSTTQESSTVTYSFNVVDTLALTKVPTNGITVMPIA